MAISEPEGPTIGAGPYGDAPGWGWLLFASTLLGLAGLMRIFDAIWAFRYNGALPEELEGALFGDELDTYGWIWLIIGAVLILASFLLINRSQFARWVGYVATTLAALSAIAWMPYYPVWSIVYIGIAILVFYALARYGGQLPA
jgi:hypothetical protein